jgi:hypothetical protein
MQQAYETARNAQHDERDLETQKATAIWTQYMAYAAIGGTAFGIIGISLVLGTFVQNKRSADAAHDANRPWIRVELAKGGIRGWRFENDNPVFLTNIVMDNVGKSPALSLSYTASFAFGGTAKAAVDAAIEHFKSGAIDWKYANLFPGDDLSRSTEVEHEGEPPGICQVSYYVVAAYKAPGNDELKFTARVWDLVDRRRSDDDREKRVIDFAHPPVGESLHLATPETFIGYAT